MAQNTGFRRWLNEARPTKTATFWSWVASAAATMIIGFTWGGWVTGGAALEMGKEMAEEAVAKRLAPICVAQFHQDPGKEQKLKEMKKLGSWYRGDYVKKQGWAKMPDEKETDSKVAEACAKLVALISL